MVKSLDRIGDLPFDTLAPVLHFVVQGLSHRIRLGSARATLNGLSPAEFRIADAIFDHIEQTERTDVASLSPERIAKYTSDLSRIVLERSRRELKFTAADGARMLRRLRAEPLASRTRAKGTKTHSSGRLRLPARATRAK